MVQQLKALCLTFSFMYLLNGTMTWVPLFAFPQVSVKAVSLVRPYLLFILMVCNHTRIVAQEQKRKSTNYKLIIAIIDSNNRQESSCEPAWQTRSRKLTRLLSPSSSHVGRPIKWWSAVTLSHQRYWKILLNSELYATCNCLSSSRLDMDRIPQPYVKMGMQRVSTRLSRTVSLGFPSMGKMALAHR